MMPADVHDIFDGAGVPSPKDALESTGLRFPTSLTANPNSQKKKLKSDAVQFKRPEGMHRELYNLLVQDHGKDVSPLMPTLVDTATSGGYRNPKAKIGLHRARHWQLVEFDHPVKPDRLRLTHWQRSDRIDQPYPFARFNKTISIPEYTNEEYEKCLTSQKWTKQETDHLFDLCRRFDLRWPVICDRWDRTLMQTNRSMEDMKQRFYNSCNELNNLRETPGAVQLCYDAEHEKRRKEQLIKLWNRTPSEVEEERMLIAEERKIDGRRRERERKAQDLQKLITSVERAPMTPTSAMSSMSLSLTAAAGHKKNKIYRNKNGGASTPNLMLGVTGAGASSGAGVMDHTGLRFPEFRSAGVHLRSQEMKLPTNIGQKKMRCIEIVIDKMKLDHMPVGAEEISRNFNEFRSEVALLHELKSALQSCEFEIESLRNRYRSITGKSFDIQPRMRVACPPDAIEAGGDGAPTSKRRIMDMIELPSSSSAMPVSQRKRKLLALQASDIKRTRRS